MVTGSTDLYYNSLPIAKKKQYEAKLELISKKKQPYTREKLQAYKSLEAYSYYINGYVQTVLYFCYESNPSVCVVKAKVHASQKATVLHLAWVAVNKRDGRIITGHCKCMAGCGEVCCHIAAIVFQVEAYIRLKIADTNASSVIDINFEKPAKRFRKEGRNSSLTVSEIEDYSATISRNDLLQALHGAFPNAVIFSVVSGLSTSDCSTVPLRKSHNIDEEINSADSDVEDLVVDLPPLLSNLFHFNVKEADIQELCNRKFDSIRVTEDQAKNLSELTKEQAESHLWMQHRVGRITASKMHQVMKCKRKQYPMSLVKSIMQYDTVNPNIPAQK
uniref:SWIM-type domain-containing protein n=1 Tax=Amphimedon queenslandica TaxID=400682 RepID=A0A1X7UDI0_AMPQE